MSFSKRLDEVAELIERRFETLFDHSYSDHKVHDAMRHALQGGKRMRAFLALESARLHGVSEKLAIWPAMAVEAIHAYSLVHDDLPCMDNDDLRRGQPTVHVKWDEATAVLAGDALQSLAFELVLRPSILPDVVPDAEARAALAWSLSMSAGANEGMVLGQAKDIEAESGSEPLSLKEITSLQAEKTGQLIMWACSVGPNMMKDFHIPSHRCGDHMAQYGHCLGLAFQIADDILDVEGDASKVGKALGKDTAAGKATFVSLLGLDAAKARANELVTEACDCLSIYGAEADCLRECARFVISRQM